MPKAKLDAAFCLTAQCEPGKKKTDYYDTVITGFVLEVRSSGGRTFWLRYNRGPKEQKAIKIAAYGDLSVDKVRKEAQRLRSEVVLGRDPAADKAEKRAVGNYKALADQHLDYARTYQKTRQILNGSFACTSCPVGAKCGWMRSRSRQSPSGWPKSWPKVLRLRRSKRSV